jgi:hypothetical protein
MYVKQRKEIAQMIIKTITLTENEYNEVMKKRSEMAKRLEAEEILDDIKAKLTQLARLGYKVEMSAIGGKYVRWHRPMVSVHDVHLSRW